MDDLKENLLRIEKWLAENAPDIKAALNPAATSMDIASLQNHEKCDLVDELIELYKFANGLSESEIANLFYGFSFLSIDSSIDKLNSLNQLQSDKFTYTDNGIEPFFNSELIRIPLAHDNSRCYIFCDLSPSAAGDVGQVIFCDFEWNIAIKLEESISKMINSFAEDLEAGEYTLAEDALEDGVQWLSASRSRDVGNWYNSPTWSHLRENVGLRAKSC
jgi:cell wall assembly regulator SMI1